MATEAAPLTKVITSLVRFSYLHIWEPVAMEEGGTKKYSVSLIIPKSDKKLVATIKKAIEAAKEAGKAKYGGKIPANLDGPLHDGDAERPEDDAYANSYYLNAKATTKPGIVKPTSTPGVVEKITDPDEIYSGCYGYASITFYAFAKSVNKGVACGLNHLMKIKEGEPLGGRTSVESDFGNIAVAEDDADDLM